MIPGITDRARLPRLGKIRLGEKKKSAKGNEYPSALDHFSFRDVPELVDVFGEDCRELYPIVLPVDDEDTWFQTSRSAYSAAGLFCRCQDGVTATRVNKGKKDGKPRDPQGAAFIEEQGLEVAEGDMFDLPCPGEDCFYFQRQHCKNLGRLFIVPVNSPKFGVYEITTSSVNSMMNILSSARAIQAATGGRLCGIPLALKLSPLQVQPEGKKKTVYVLELEFRDGGIKALMSAARKPAGLIGTPDPQPGSVPDDLYPQGGKALAGALGERETVDAPAEADTPNKPSDLFTEGDAEPDKKVAERKESTRKAVQKAAASVNDELDDASRIPFETF